MAQSIAPQFPVVCPTCGRKTGMPVGTSDPTRNVITVMLTCSSCRRMWTLQADEPPVIPANERGR
jgi:hypothetical protein